MTCPFLIIKAINHRYDITGNLIDFDTEYICTLTRAKCQCCTAIQISNRNADSRITLYRPDYRKDLYLKDGIISRK